MKLARYALFVHADRSERLHLDTVGLGGGQRVVNFGIIDLDGFGLLFGSEREQVGFIGTGAVETPGAGSA